MREVFDKYRKRSIVAIAVLLAAWTLSTNPGASLTVVGWIVSLTHPSTPSVSPHDLVAELAGRRRPVLVDVRPPAEFAVSRLPNAKSAPALDLTAPPFDGLDRATPIVVYSAVGWLGAKQTGALRTAGFTNVRNLDRGIFGWAANHGRLEMERPGPPKVHPSGGLLSRLLPDSLRADV